MSTSKKKVKKEEKKFVTLKDITIPKGTVLHIAPSNIQRYEPHFEIIIGYGNDHIAEFVIDKEAIEHFPEIFTELKE